MKKRFEIVVNESAEPSMPKCREFLHSSGYLGLTTPSKKGGWSIACIREDGTLTLVGGISDPLIQTDKKGRIRLSHEVDAETRDE